MAARKKKQTPAQRRASLRNIKKAQAARRKQRAPARRKTTKRRTTKRRATARKPARRKTTTRRKTVARRPARRKTASRRRTVSFRPVRGRVYNRNPRITVRGVMRDLRQGVVDAGGVVVGKAATRFLANLVPLPKDTAIMNFAVQGLSAVTVGIVARMALSKRMADFMVAGGLAAPIETFLAGVPVIGPMLGEYDPYLPMGEYDPTLPMGEYPAMGEYPMPSEVEVGEW